METFHKLIQANIEPIEMRIFFEKYHQFFEGQDYIWDILLKNLEKIDKLITDKYANKIQPNIVENTLTDKKNILTKIPNTLDNKDDLITKTAIMIRVRDMENRILFLEKKCYGGLRILR